MDQAHSSPHSGTEDGGPAAQVRPSTLRLSRRWTSGLNGSSFEGVRGLEYLGELVDVSGHPIDLETLDQKPTLLRPCAGGTLD